MIAETESRWLTECDDLPIVHRACPRSVLIRANPAEWDGAVKRDTCLVEQKATNRRGGPLFVVCGHDVGFVGQYDVLAGQF